MILNAHSQYSLRYGVLTVDQLVEQAVAMGHASVALTDINSTAGVLEFVQKARSKGIKPLAGIEFRSGNRLHYVGIARSAAGFQRLNGFLSGIMARAALGIAPPAKDGIWEMARSAAQRGLEEGDAVPEGPGSVLPTALRNVVFPAQPPDLGEVVFIHPLDSAPPSVELGAHEFVAVTPRDLNKLFSSPLRQATDRLVCWLPVTLADADDYDLHLVLRAIDCNTLLSKIDGKECAAKDEVMYSPSKFEELYADHPHILDNTRHLAEACSFEMDITAPKNKLHFTSSVAADFVLLRKLASSGFARRYPTSDRAARDRLESELRTIRALGFCAYFLITNDFVAYAKSKGYFHVGRGSGANSIVAYCLGITDVDPIALNLYFERFLNPHRTSPPDFDIDFSWADRDDVIDYVFKRYGHAHTAFVCTYARFQGRSILRELGKVFGLPKEEIDALVANRHTPRIEDNCTRMIYRFAKRLEGMPNYLGMHPGGILISEQPIHAYTATFVPPKGFPVTHLDMHAAEDAGLHKYDVLSQRGLGHIRSTVELVLANKGVHVDIHDVTSFMAEDRIARMLRNGRTIGCFYVESPAMRQLLRKLHCDDYPTLVAASSVIRPGVARSGMMDAYIRRHLFTLHPDHLHRLPKNRRRPGDDNPSSWYLHPSMRDYLGETYGVMVYQEDVIKVAHYFGGVDLGEADVLRRAMSGKYRSFEEFRLLKEKFFSNCAAKGIDAATVAEVWRQMESFAGYSFCKAHSASFAVESYQSLHLKANHPLEFMVGVINNFGGFYRTEIYVHTARLNGATVHAPCVNESELLTTIRGTDIHLGFVHVKGLSRATAEAIVAARRLGGAFLNLTDFFARVQGMTESQAFLLGRLSAFRFTGRPKKTLLWEIGTHFSGMGRTVVQGPLLFRPEEKSWKIPDFPEDAIEDAYDQLELLGFPLLSPFSLATEAAIAHEAYECDLRSLVGRMVTIRGYLVSTKTVKTVRNELMGFLDFIDAKGMFFDCVLFPDTYDRNLTPTIGVYAITGRVIDDFGVPSIEVKAIRRIPYKPDPRYSAEDLPPAVRAG